MQKLGFLWRIQLLFKIIELINQILHMFKINLTNFLSYEGNFYLEKLRLKFKEISYHIFLNVRSENCRKFSPTNRRHHNWEPIHQSSTLRVTIDAIGQCG